MVLIMDRLVTGAHILVFAVAIIAQAHSARLHPVAPYLQFVASLRQIDEEHLRKAAMDRRSRIPQHIALFLVVLCCLLLSFPTLTSSSPQSAVRMLGNALPRTSQKDQTAPTAIEYFDAHTIRSGIKLLWCVFSDKDVDGFRLYRMAEDDSYISVINKRGLIPAWHQNFIDSELLPSTTYRYLLGVVYSDGSESLSQPIAVRSPKAAYPVAAVSHQPK